MTEPNLLLDALIAEAGLSHAGLAARINAAGAAKGLTLRYDHASVARWIRDQAIPRNPAPDLICEIIGGRVGRMLTLADIGMTGRDPSPVSLSHAVDSAAALWRGDHNRHHAVRRYRLVTGPGAIMPLFEWENPPDDMLIGQDRAGRWVTPADIDGINHVRALYEEMYRRAGGIPVRPRIVARLNSQVAPLLRRSYSDAVGRQLFRAAGALVALAGICSYDADEQALAQRYYFTALRLAKASRDKAFGGYVVALLTNQAMHLGNHRQVVQYAETALRAAHGCITPALQTDLYTLQAKAYARMGHRDACHRQMSAAEATFPRVNSGDEPPELGYVQPGLVEVQHAEALRQLGDLAAAQTYAQAAVDGVDGAHIRGQFHRLATLSLVLAGRRSVDHAVEVAGQMLDRAQGMESRRVRERMVTVRRAFQPYGSSPGPRDIIDRAGVLIGQPLGTGR